MVRPLEFLDLDISHELPALESIRDICFRKLISSFKMSIISFTKLSSFSTSFNWFSSCKQLLIHLLCILL